MKNGIRFRMPEQSNNLVLIHSPGDGDENSAGYFSVAEQGEGAIPAESVQPHSVVLVLASVSLACMVTAIVTGSYAAWLTRQRLARQALTDVNDILRSCQARMQQLESDVQRLPRL